MGAMADELAVKGYGDLLERLEARVGDARLRASTAVNTELVTLYWEIGREILERQEKRGWGAKVIEQLSADLRKAFPQMRGFSARNLTYMRTFAGA